MSDGCCTLAATVKHEASNHILRVVVRATLIGWIALMAIAPFGCEGDHAGASAEIITGRGQLIGGDRAAGEIGDYLLQNEKVRFIIHKAGLSRGFGVYGGSLIDADLRRPHEQAGAGDGHGFDNFSEMFPAMFLQAVAVDKVTIVNDGSDGGAARIEASGSGGDFMEMLGIFNRIVTGSHGTFLLPQSTPRIHYATIYELEPDSSYLTIRFRVTNLTEDTLTFPGRDKGVLEEAGLPLDDFKVPIGDVALFGATAQAFAPGVGFDLHFGLQRAYKKGTPWPGFPGVVTDFIASRGHKTSYGIAARSSSRNFVDANRNLYGDGDTPISNSSILIPFTASSALGAFYEYAPDELPPQESFEVVKYFIVGSGDVGSIADVVHEIRGFQTGRLGGNVVEGDTGAPAEGASVIVYQRRSNGELRIYSQYDAKAGGAFSGTLPPGAYSLKIVGHGRTASELVDFDITSGKTTALRVETQRPARIFVHARNAKGQLLPAKATAVGSYEEAHSGQEPMSFLFDLAAGESFRTSDLVADTSAPETRRYIESIAFANQGVAELVVRPGTYEVVSSRGPEYDLARSVVTVQAGRSETVNHQLTRVVDTSGWVAVDPHVHSRASTDSPMTIDERVRSLAAEGVETPVATDHNVITDYEPYVARNDLTRWLRPVIGLELTTLESGHFNGYPLSYNPGLSTHGSFEWAKLAPDDIFNRLRSLGSLSPADTIVQVNHPRDQLLGYYGQYNRHGITHDEVEPAELTDQFLRPPGPAFKNASGGTTFSFEYDAVELVNGKLFWEIHHYRVPEELPDGELPDEIPPAGSILLESDGDVAFPGVVDDWFNLLNLGYRFVGVGSSDSHNAYDEVGYFRTMVYVGDDRPEAVGDEQLVVGLQSRRVLATNGPLLDFYVDDPKAGVMGSTIKVTGSTVEVHLSLTSAPWMGISRINIYNNGVIADFVEVDPARDLAANPLKDTVTVDVDEDSWIVLEAIGYDSMFPVVRPAEIPPLLLLDAVGNLSGPLGLAQDDFGALRPAETFRVTPYAITNPVWVTTSSSEFRAPGLVPIEELNDPKNDSKLIFGSGVAAQRARRVKRLSHPSERLDKRRNNVPLFHPLPGNRFDVRHAFSRNGLPHGH